jgi:DNA replication and repair protein RecF
MVRVWDQDLVEQGVRVGGFREAYVQALKPFIEQLGHQLMGLEIGVEHQRGWKQGGELESTLADAWQRDQLRGVTSIGPHRADLVVKVADQTAKDRVSRGQQKLLACCLILSQQLHRAAIGAPPACLLIDDPAAELDVDNLGKLLAVIADIPTQLVVTGLNSNVLEFLPAARLFHVEHGVVQAMA